MKPELNLKNVKSFLQGYSRIVYDRLIGLPAHTQEQIAYRHALCADDCFVPDEDGEIGCKHCGCDPYGKAFATESCNEGERFPDLMGKKEWEIFIEKQLNEID